MTRKSAELIGEENKKSTKKEQVSSRDNNTWENMGLMFYYKSNDINNEIKDMSFSGKAIHPELEKLSKEDDKLKMKLQVMQTLTEATIQRVGSFEKAIFQMNKGLLHVLNLINQAPEGKISTRELLRIINSTSMHKYLKEAEELGFIKRYTERMPQGQKGGVMIMNSLTEEGRVLLKLHDELASSSRESRQHQ